MLFSRPLVALTQAAKVSRHQDRQEMHFLLVFPISELSLALSAPACAGEADRSLREAAMDSSSQANSLTLHTRCNATQDVRACATLRKMSVLS